ncbi:MAG: DUF3108 domain-containing protein [Alphaproteobacteria bacterium]|nr:DUF3108 domain-containing protein [Alphaproteobacteria bacterium]MBV9064023.1 DUF3108 domain-containing protein [Alphaproteobacteria bacterium]
MSRLPPQILLPLLLLLTPAQAGAEKPPSLAAAHSSRLSLQYSIAFWTIPFGRTSFEVRLSPGGYATSSHFETSGIVSAFWQSIIDATSTGTISAQGISPTLYDSYYRRGSKHQRVRLTYGRDGMPITYADPLYTLNKYPVSDAQKKEGLDPLGAATAVLAGLSSSPANPCGTVAAVFDGRRRYNIEFTYLRDEPVKLEGLYSGSAHLCQLHYNQIAGFKPKILKEGRALPPAYAWVADFPDTAMPIGRYLLPLKLWAATGFGTVTATLVQKNG